MKLVARFGTIIFLIALVSCKDTSFFGALGDKVASTPPLVIAPVSATLAIGSSVTFGASGGVPPIRTKSPPVPGRGQTCQAASLPPASGEPSGCR